MDNPQIPTLADAPTLPANLEAEQALLGSILLDNRVFDSIDGIAEADKFHEKLHGQIYGLFARMITAGQVVNPVTAFAAFSDHPTLKDLGGGRKYLAVLASHACDEIAAPDYARMIRDLACRREIIRFAEEAKSKAFDQSLDGEDWSSIVSTLKHDAEGLSDGMRDDRVVTGSQVIASLAGKLEEGVKLIPTGIDRLDRSFGGGMRPGKLYAFEGQAKRFKSGFASAIFEGVVKSGRKAMFLTLEMSPDDIFQRLAAGHAGMNFGSLENDGFKSQNIKRVFDYQRDMGGLDNALFMHIPGASYSEIMSYVTRAKTEYGCDLVVVDYWQRIRGEMKDKTDAANLEMIANHLADLLEKVGMAGILASQLNRNDFSLGSDGLQRACSWRARINKVEFATNDPDFTKAGLWLEVSENRYGPSGHVGTEEEPAFEIAPGPVLKEFS